MGLFSSSNTSPEYFALVARWESFVKKLYERYTDVMKQSEGPLSDVMNSIQYDSVVFININTGLKNQVVDQLCQKGDEGWAKMSAELAKINASSSDVGNLRQQLVMFKQWAALEFERYEVKIFADAARKILENVKQHINESKLHRCTQCAAELPINVYSFMAVNIKCESCGSVNTYQPDDRVRALEYYVLNHLAEEQAFDLKIKGRHERSAAKEYYLKYYGYLMETVPEKKDFYKRDMDERISWVENGRDPYIN
jgi:hypothetical protein